MDNIPNIQLGGMPDFGDTPQEAKDYLANLKVKKSRIRIRKPQELTNG